MDKSLYIGLMVLLILPMVLAIEEQFIDIGADVYFEKIDDDTANLRIAVEGYNSYRPSLMLSYFITHIGYVNDTTNTTYWIWNASKEGGGELSKIATPITFTINKNLGNQSELFDIINTCNEMSNFSSLWELCMNQRLDLELQILNEMVNKTWHYDIETNLTTRLNNIETTYETYKTTKDAELEEKNKRIGDLERHRQYGWLIGIVGLIVAGYTLNKYVGWGKRKHQEQTEFPKDVSS